MPPLKRGTRPYAKPMIRKHQSLEKLKEQWKAVRHSLQPLIEHTKDYEIVLARIAKDVKRYDPGAGSVGEARARLKSMENDIQPTMGELRNVLDGIEDMHRTLIAIFDEILHHPGASSQLKETILAEVQKTNAARERYTNTHQSAERIRTAVLMKQGILIKREPRRRQ